MRGSSAVTENPRGAGVLSSSSKKGGGTTDLFLTFTHDGIHYLKMTSKARATGSEDDVPPRLRIPYQDRRPLRRVSFFFALQRPTRRRSSCTTEVSS